MAGTAQKLSNDAGPVAERPRGFRGHNFALGTVITYEMKINGKHPLSASLRWVPTAQLGNA
ncbi:hypothetical protein [Paraburkholderia sp. BL17N1]|uniref:hypothetical protein n=1 Tax=Paraburkholderia sp. BL17N1 TaxID=1938798 RepID=UPI0018F74A6A|nr:hypothetical protein [Paraburkholderia sp. BL17N1]